LSVFLIKGAYVRLGSLLTTTRCVVAAAVCSTIALPAVGGTAVAAESNIPTVKLKLLAAAPMGATKPDDITNSADCCMSRTRTTPARTARLREA
jgi:hypothetical protein